MFWTSPKRPPIALPFDKENFDHQKFILSVVKILCSIIPLNHNCDEKMIFEKIKDLKVVRKKASNAS